MRDDEILRRLRRFHNRYFPRSRRRFRELVSEGQHPTALFIGCSDSQVVPHLLTGSGAGELFIVRNVGNLVPPFDAAQGYQGTSAAIEFAVLKLGVSEIVVCGHSHCDAVAALYSELPSGARHLRQWLELGREAAVPGPASDDALRRTEQRLIVLQLERLTGYPMVAERLEAGQLTLHGWHYVIEDGTVLVLDLEHGEFVPPDAPSAGETPASVDLLQ